MNSSLFFIISCELYMIQLAVGTSVQQLNQEIEFQW